MERLKNIRLSRRWRIMIIIAAALTVLCVVCLLAYGSVAHRLEAQCEAERWQGESETAFAQISCFLPAEGTVTLDGIYSFRTEMMKKLHEAAADIDTDSTLFTDAWSTFGKVKVSNGNKRRADVTVTAVGGNYFDFHPLRLLSGNYIKADDLMKDRVLLDPDTAWLLFGGTELSGMSFSINGVPYVVAGVVEREDDRFSKKAYGDTGMGIYMSYDGYCALLNQSSSVTTDSTTPAASTPSTKPGISCYEIVLAEPVKNFAYNAVKDKFPIGSGEIVDNTHRFDTENIWKLAKDVTARSMRGSAVVYPYWENAARGAEDTCALYMLCAIVTGLFPAGLALFVLIRGIVRGKTKLEEDVFPKWKENISEAIRVRERKRWEKEHPGET